MATWIVGERRSGSGSVSSSGGKIQLTESYVYLIETDDHDTTRVEVLTTVGLPFVGLTTTAYGATCAKKSATRSKENTLFWEVTCEYDSNQNQTGTGDPDTWYPVFDLNFETYEEFVTRDKDGNKFLNSAGDRFDYDFSVTRRLISIDFFQYESASLSEVQISDRNETINSNSFVGYAAKTLLLTIKKASKGYLGGSQYWRIEYKMTYKKATWETILVQEGPRYLTLPLPNPNSKKEHFTTGNPPEFILGLLAADGTKLPDGSPMVEAKFPRYDELDFASFIRRGP